MIINKTSSKTIKIYGEEVYEVEVPSELEDYNIVICGNEEIESKDKEFICTNAEIVWTTANYQEIRTEAKINISTSKIISFNKVFTNIGNLKMSYALIPEGNDSYIIQAICPDCQKYLLDNNMNCPNCNYKFTKGL